MALFATFLANCDLSATKKPRRGSDRASRSGSRVWEPRSKVAQPGTRLPETNIERLVWENQARGTPTEGRVKGNLAQGARTGCKRHNKHEISTF